MHTPTHRQARGFTYIEMLVVLVIIAILVAISLQIGRTVVENGKARQTQATLAILEQTLTTYLTEKQGQFPSGYVDDEGRQYPLFDGRCTQDDGDPASYTKPAYPSLALYLQVARRSASNESLLRGIDPALIQPVTMGGANFASWTQPKELAGTQFRDIALYTILDGWGQPIRFVHPDFDGGFGTVYRPNGPGATTFGTVGRSALQLTVSNGAAGSTNKNFRRSAQPFSPADTGYIAGKWLGDADEGLCPGQRPYFYSAGPDGNPGSRGDNVYTTKPNFPTEGATAAQ